MAEGRKSERFFVDVAPHDRTAFAVYDLERPDAWTGSVVVAGPFASWTAAVIVAEHCRLLHNTAAALEPKDAGPAGEASIASTEPGDTEGRG